MILFTDRGELDRRRKLPISDLPDIGENRNRCTGHTRGDFRRLPRSAYKIAKCVTDFREISPHGRQSIELDASN